MLRRFICVISVLIAAFPLMIASVRGQIIEWSPSTAQPGYVRARLAIDKAQHDLDLRIIKPPVLPQGGTLLIESGNGVALAPLSNLSKMTIATIDLSPFPEALRGQAWGHLIAKLKSELGAAHVLAHGDAMSSPTLIANAGLFDGLLIENMAPPATLRAPRIIALVGADAPAKVFQAATAREAEPVNQRRFYLANTPLASPGKDPSCETGPGRAPADAARRAMLVVLDAWTRGEKPPASRFPGASDLAPARTLKWPKIPGFSPPKADDRPAPIINVDGNQISGLLMPDQSLPIATYTNVEAFGAASGKPCAGVAMFPFAATRASREAKDDPRLSLVERYGSRAYYVATLRVIADRLVRERLLLPQDADAYVAAGKVAPF